MRILSKAILYSSIFLLLSNLNTFKNINLLKGEDSGKNSSQRNLIILDPGHGGKDHGTRVAGIDEDEIVYDISVRTLHMLINEGYNVHQTVYDANTKFNPQENLINNEEEYLLDGNGKGTKIKKDLNKRCSLINKIYHSSQDPLVSIHVNYALPFIKGACIYYPPKELCGSRVEEKSIKLAKTIIKSFRDYNIPTHSIGIFGIVDLNILWDVLGYNKFNLAIFKKTDLENKILIECGNLNNKDDRERLLDADGRQRISYAIYKGIISYFQQQ